MLTSDYSRAERWLHRLALSSDVVPEMSFDIEQALFGGKAPAAMEPPVFVAGLARAGTTLWMRLLHQTGSFASLTYRDMPFVLAPNLWHRISAPGRQAGEFKPRAHGDGLEVSVDSPEALEEVFWRVHCRDQYLDDQCLNTMSASVAVLKKFEVYQRLIGLRYGRPRYLSKNNNNILRLASLRQAFPQAAILVPYRHPADQAESLLRQHRRFLEIHREGFSRAYMRWLVHHEFGRDHRPFQWATAAAAQGSPLELEYWVTQWHHSYAHLLRQATPLNLKFLCYERLCETPQQCWRALAAELGIASELPAGLAVNAPAPRATRVSLPPETEALYHGLAEHSLTKSSTAAT